MSRPERVQAAFEAWEGKPELGPNATAMFEYIIRLEAEVTRLTAERDEWQRQHDLKDHRCFALAQRAENAEAETARLREAVMPAVASLAAAISLLERSPKTGAASSKMFDIMLNDYGKALDTARAALKPDTGEMSEAEKMANPDTSHLWIPEPGEKP